MPDQPRDISSIDRDNYPYIFEQNADIPVKTFTTGLIRANVYRPKTNKPVPVLITCGPYGKDVPYADFNATSYADVNPTHKSEHAAWETPNPTFWTAHGYAVVRADELGTGQSPGILDTFARSGTHGFFDVIEWAAAQPWSSGKVGLLGISYYALSQWRVAALQPKGLAAMVPWEGMADLYEDAARHGGIFSNEFIEFWWNRQVVTNQYGRPGREAAHWGPDTLEGDLTPDELAANRRVQYDEIAQNKFRDDVYYASQDYHLGNVKAPLLSVANWGGIGLHLRGNVLGYMNAGSEFKYLRFIVGRHDLPFYVDEQVEVQRSFLDAFLKGDDRVGWAVKGKVPPVDLVLRKGAPGFDDAASEAAAFPRRTENEWPIARTQYTKFYLTADHRLDPETPRPLNKTISYKALGTAKNPQSIQFTTAPFPTETEITGHIVLRLNISCTALPATKPPSDIDIFTTLRHFTSSGAEISYTGTMGDPVPVVKGWLRASLRKIDDKDPTHRSYLPHRKYRKVDVQAVAPGEVYTVDVEMWPTNVVVGRGSTLAVEIGSGDTQGAGIFGHSDGEDRSEEVFAGSNTLHFSNGYQNYITLPIIPQR